MSYTKEEFDEIAAFYQEGSTLEQLSEVYGHSVASLRMKLVKAGLYLKANPELVTFKSLFAKYGPALV